ncbi:hypothetical protein GQX73_g506 [Xylaria multiplex]|uniref:Wax synthase domain-containing protein n=1 Tax=Xylaria multiplex TaxID=323545 RepID=A0A7C8IY12_9PEZI|nr:hypothetical protein GQX73_g506 [Xylaria multiplex]
MLPFRIVADILYGELNEEMIADLKDIVPLREVLFKQMINGGLTRFSLSRFLPTAANRGMTTFQTRWRAFNDRAYERARELGGFTKPVVSMYEAAHKGPVTFEHVLQTLDECLFANLDVTTGAMAWNIIFLAANEDYQGKLVKELALHSTTEGRRRYILNNSTLLASCISESARLRPAAAFSVPQSAPTTRVIDGYVIPAGTDIIIDAYSLNMRGDFWGLDADTYRPERFLEKSSVEQRYHYWRFGFGPRQCLGKYLADIVIRSLIIYFVENYKLRVYAHLHPHFTNDVGVAQPFTIAWSYYLATLAKLLFSGPGGPETRFWRLNSTPQEATRYRAFSWRKIRWAFALIANQRGVRWNHEVKNVHPPEARGKAHFLALQAWKIGNLQYAQLSFISVALGLSRPEDWPPPFGAITDVTTVRQFWGKYWHQQLRHMLTSYTDAFIDTVGIPRGTNWSSYTTLYLAFIFSGMFHALSQRQMPCPVDVTDSERVTGFFLFFVWQAAAITFEDFTQWCWKRVLVGNVEYLGEFAACRRYISLTLYRQLHKVLILDDQKPRNVWSHPTHIVSGWEGRQAEELRAAACAELSNTGLVDFEEGTATSVTRGESCFEITTEECMTFRGRKLLIATGKKNVFPDIPGFADNYPEKIFHCMFTFGYENRGAKLAGLLAEGALATPFHAKMVIGDTMKFAERVRVFTNGDSVLRAKMDAHIGLPGVTYEDRPITCIRRTASSLGLELDLEGGSSETIDFLVHQPRTEINILPLVKQLGLELDDRGDIKNTPPFYQTDHPGVFVAGDCATPFKIIPMAMFMGAQAGAGIARSIAGDGFLKAHSQQTIM